LVEKIPHDSPVLVIGLGRFGAATAGELDKLGRDVLAVDEDPALVQKWADRVTHTAVLDARNINALQQVGAKDFPIAVVATGSSIEASVLITTNLVDLKVPQIWAKAISESHGKILTRIGAHRVIYPEREAGERVAHLVSGRMIDFIRFDDNFAQTHPRTAARGFEGALEISHHGGGCEVAREAFHLRNGKNSGYQPRSDYCLGNQRRHRSVRSSRQITSPWRVRTPSQWRRPLRDG